MGEANRRRSGAEQHEYYWIAVNGASCAMSSAPMRHPVVIPTPEQMWGFHTLEEAERAQHVCLHQPIPEVIEFFQSLEPHIHSGRIRYVRPAHPEPPTRGETMWVDDRSDVPVDRPTSESTNGKGDDPQAAREAVLRDRRRVEERMRLEPSATLKYYEDLDGLGDRPDGDGERTVMQLVIGERDKLTKADARRAALNWQSVTRRYPKAVFIFAVVGYDDDPRELWEFDAVRRYLRQWARFAGLTDIETADRWLGSCAGRLDPPLSREELGPAGAYVTGGAGILAACGAFGEQWRQTALANFKPAMPN
jgi:hypothetical protein